MAIYTRIHGFLSQSLGLIKKEAERKKGREMCIIIILGTLAPFYRVKVMYGTRMCVMQTNLRTETETVRCEVEV